MQRSRRALWTVLLGALAFSASGVLWRPGPAWDLAYDLVAYNLTYVAAAMLCWQRRASVTGARALTAALLVNAAGNATYSLWVVRLDPEPFPSVADGLYLAAYPFLCVAVLGAVRRRAPRLTASMWLDGLVAGLGAIAVAAASLLGPALTLADGDPAAVMTNLAYPAADVLLLLVLMGGAGTLGLRADRGVVAIGAAVGCYLVADLLYLHRVALDGYTEGGWLDQLWLLGTAGLALACSLPGEPVRVSPAGALIGWRVLALPLTCSLASSAVLLAGYDDELPVLAGAAAAACWLAGLVRTTVTFREIRDLRQVRQQASTDELTGLHNRRALHEGWALLPAAPRRALVLFDLDSFKQVNDSLGHAAGDELLRQVARRVGNTVHQPAVVVRLGGDEFAVAVSGGDDVGEVLACRLQAALEPHFDVEGVRLHVRASFGVAAAPDPLTTLPEMLRRADVAMYEAKRTRSGTASYSADLGAGMADRLRVVDELRTALTDGQLLVHLQLQVRPADGVVVGAEALVRWQHPSRGLLTPAALLPAVDQAGLMGPLSARVLDLALSAAAQWWPRHAVPVGVNLCAADVTDLALPERIGEALRKHGLPPQALVVEIVEDTLVKDPARATGVLAALRETGIGVAIDDYGTGYSSLAYLKDLPADILKIDRVFVRELATDPRTAAIVEATVGLAHRLGLTVVAEGVEDAETLQILAALGCDTAQGFHLARPEPLEVVLRELDRRAGAGSAPDLLGGLDDQPELGELVLLGQRVALDGRGEAALR